MNSRETYEDKFARKFWCLNAKRRYTKFIKRKNRRCLRRIKQKETTIQDA